jgi:hypothetical protein
MKKTLALLLVAQMACAHAFTEDPYAPFDTSTNSDVTMTVTWKPVDNVQKTCEAENRKRGHAGFGYSKIQACSFWLGNECTIYTSKRPNMLTLGHELRHCYQQNWHQ